MKRRSFLAAPALLGLTAKAADARPNILYILTDDQRWDAMSCAGHPFVKTPNMDRLAREGARFQNAFVTTPLCSPSRASFLTGQFAHRHGILDNSERNEQSHTLVTFPKILRDNGYESAYIGKWHMGHRDDTPRPGFDHWISFKGQGQYVDPEMNRNGERGRVSGYVTDILSNDAADYIRKARSKPFCLTLSHKAIHAPFTPAERHKDLFSDVTIQRAPSASDDLSGKPALRLSQTKPQASAPPRPHRGPTDDTIKNMMRALVAVDEGLGKVFDALAETRQLDNTLIVFAGDNGYFYGEHGLGDKRRAYEEGIRIPLLMRYPKLVRAGSKPTQMALNIDLAPTVLELAGVRAPASMQGQSLLPVLKGKAKGRESILTEYFVDPPYPATQKWQSIRTERWKWIHYPELENAGELYDLREDAGEMTNRIGDREGQKVLPGMRKELSRWLHA